MEKHDTHNVFDKVFKRLILSSTGAVIHLINGLFGTEYPLDSSIEYPNTEFITEQMKQLYPDILIVIGGIHQYHLEAQIQDDKHMALRIFEYGFQYALRHKTESKGLLTLSMPRSCVIYLTAGTKKSNQPSFRLLFPDGSTHIYKTRAFYLLNHDIKELEERNMVILLPFYILKLRKAVEKAGNHKKLKELSAEAAAMVDEILKSAERSEKRGILNTEEVRLLIELLDRLYTEVYRNYVEFKEADMRLQDIIMTRVEEAEARKEAEVEARLEAKMEELVRARSEELAEARLEEFGKENTREIVRKMKKIGLSAEQIAQVSGFSVKEIEEL
ncbi:MAG: hypothetical protein LBK83_12730 [Treponema sp.]|jgi:predicted transposase YdaD|nr:hypothetical protein [Treponema sp.]